MNKGISLLNEIKGGGYEASLIATFNAYLPFYEDVVLRKLRNQGARHNVLLMDATQFAQAIVHYPPRLAGRYYSLLPMPSPGAFHPKMIFLVGKNRGALLVGSHNLTLAGFGFNRELTNLIQVRSREDNQSIALLQSTWRQILRWLDALEDSPRHLLDMVQKVGSFAPWLRQEPGPIPEDCRIISSQPDSHSLWDQFANVIQGTAKRVILTGAFFDAQFEFLQHIKNELRPKKINVGIDPKTVQIPGDQRLPGFTFHNCSSLGPTEKGGEQTGYLHAKAIVVQTFEGSIYLAVGSANPSAPAWMKPRLSGNTEMVIIRTGHGAEQVAKELRLVDIPNMPLLSELDWQIAQKNWRRRIEGDENESFRVGIALATKGGIVLECKDLKPVIQLVCDVLNAEKEILMTSEATGKGSRFFLAIPDEIMALASFVRFVLNKRDAICLIHHQGQVEEHARSGTQRRFREALASLSTDSPDLNTLIRCVDKIIFAKADDKDRSTIDKKFRKGSTNIKHGKDIAEGKGLSVDIKDTRKTKQRYRLRQSDDLAYLLDVLIYHLRLDVANELDTLFEERDPKGRSEEEQVGAEDCDEKPEDGLTAEEIAVKTLALCHSKVRTLVSRIIGQLDAFSTHKVLFEEIILRLTGVLALLRQIRNCDGKVTWIKPGQTAFPLKERSRLLESIVRNLFEDFISTHYSKDELFDADELARLRGLVIWLVWDSGMEPNTKESFFEPPEETSARMRSNAIMMALAQLVGGDEVVAEEARESIGPLCSSDMDWLNWVFSASHKLQDFLLKPTFRKTGQKAAPGDIVVNTKMPALGVRLVLSRDNHKVNLAYFGGKKEEISYIPDALEAGSFEILMT